MRYQVKALQEYWRHKTPFRCGFQPEGKPYREYVAHIAQCMHTDCAQRRENRKATLRDMVTRGVIYEKRLDNRAQPGVL